VALATFATITANGGIARATAETITDASTEYRSITAQESTNKPMQVAISAKYQRLSARDGCGPGSLSPSVTTVRCPDRGGSNAAGAAYGSAAVRLVMFRCMFDESAVLDGLNEQQRRAATQHGGPLLVLAGAGTGKTRTLVARAAWLHGSQGVPASRILLLTFTRRAASDMLARAAAWFDGSLHGTEGGDRICGGTFHAIAHKIIRQHAESFSLPPQFTILDQGDATDLLDVLRPDHGLDGTGLRAPRAAACADIYTRCVNTGRPVSEVVTAGFPWCKPFTAQLAALFRAYTARKRARNLLDFDDLLLLWQAALADPAAGPVLRGMFDAVLVDEYQDVNAVQASIVRLLQPDGKQLTCVGDDAQAIYGFRGADPAHLRQLTADYPGLDVVRLDRNYRSRQGVLDLANVIRPSSSGLGLRLTGDRGQGMAPLLVRCHDEATQAREICARVLEAHEDGAALRDQAVLVRAAHHSDMVEIELSARKVPYVKFGGLRFTDTAHVKDFLAAARILVNPADELAWFRLLRLHEGIGPAHARRILDALDPEDGWAHAVEVAPPRSRRALAVTLGRLADAAQPEGPAQQTAAQPVAAQPGAAAQAMAVLALLDPLIRARYPDATARVSDLQRLADAAAAQPSLHDVLAELTLDPPVSSSDLAGPPRLDDDYLTISTIHAAKGLEWPIVHLPHLVDGALPSDMALGDPGGLAEEHRLFYVAVTRARDHLYLYAPQRLHLHRRGRDDRHGFGQLTRFLDAEALAACESVTAAPLAPVLPAVGSLATQVDAALGALWDG
jgi:DNA helicase-2/ATP-dependent DNA helicase PcrA